MPPHPLTPLRIVLAWPVASQQRSRRNAMVASTALAEQRRQRLDAEDFLTAQARRHRGRRRPNHDHSHVI